MTTTSSTPWKRIALAILILTISVAFTVHALDETGSGMQEMVQTELFFGRSIPSGGLVTDLQWNTFLAEEVTPRFPNGFTVYDAKGQWKDTKTGAIIQEPSNALMVVYTAQDLQPGTISTIINAYKKQFAQQSVMRVDSKVLVGF